MASSELNLQNDKAGIDSGEVDTRLGSLDEVKERTREISYMGAKVLDLGIIDEVTEGVSGKDIWKGHYSLADRLNETGTDSDLNLNELQRATELLSESFVPTPKEAAIRCIHAGQIADYNSENATDFGRHLGPQFPAGTIGFGISRRLAMPSSDLKTAELVEDFDAESKIAYNLGFKPGNHQGMNATESATGCGAVDGAKDILDIFADSKRSEAAKKVTVELISAVYGEEAVKMDLIDQVYAHGVKLADVKNSYIPSKKDMLDLVEGKNPKGAPRLGSNDNTAFIVVNNEPNTTLHTDEFDAKTNNNIKAFSLDLWHIQQVANETFSNSDDQYRFTVAAVSFTVMAAMTLTDGTLRLIARTPDAK
jgi:hypothetical protein